MDSPRGVECSLTVLEAYLCATRNAKPEKHNNSIDVEAEWRLGASVLEVRHLGK
jgi:hypothetical protein